jgi:hypothetical protein
LSQEPRVEQYTEARREEEYACEMEGKRRIRANKKTLDFMG